jgi:uncharacterized protein YggE
MAQDNAQLQLNPELVVRGEYVSEVDPELVHILTELSARARRRDDVFERLRERSEWQRGVIDRFGSKIEKEETTAQHVHPIVDRESSDMPVGYIGEIRTKITVKDLGCVGDLVSDLSLGDMSEVTAVVWALRPQSPVFRATRIAAVHDAMSRARDYCAAVGSQITGLLSVVEPARPSVAAPAEPTEAPRIVTPGAHQVGALYDFRPVKQTVRAEVEARFTIMPPRFG